MEPEVVTPALLLVAGVAAGRAAARVATPYIGGPSARRDWAIALVCGAACGAFGWRLGLTAPLPAFLYLGVVGTLLLFIDAAVRRLPDPLTLPSYPVGVVLLGAAAPFVDGGGSRFWHALAGMAALWALYGIQHFLLPDHMGRGDVKLAGVLGLYLGWFGLDVWFLGTLLGFVLGGLLAVGLLVTRRVSRKAHMPHGPFMLAGAFLAIVAG